MTDILLELPSRLETDDIYTALLVLLERSPAAQMKLAEEKEAYLHLLRAKLKQHLWVYGDFAILIDVGSPWYTTKPVLIEEIILRFRRGYGNTVESAIAQLDVLAREFTCVAIAAGDTQVGYMTPRYLAAGFTNLGTQFFKEVP